MDEARMALLMDENRHTITRNRNGKSVEETICLRDWFLPALYQQAGDPRIFDPSISSQSPPFAKQGC